MTATDIAERLPHGGALERHGGMATVTWPDGSVLNATLNARTLDLAFAPSAAVAPSVHGLLGDGDGKPADDLTGRDGTVLDRSDPDFGTKLYSQFGNSWRISQAQSLFDYQPGESTATFTDLSIPSAPVTVDSIPAAARANAEAVCQAAGVRSEPLLDDCLIDVGMTGIDSYAAATAAAAASGQGAPAPNDVTPISLGQSVSGTIASPTETADYTFAGVADGAVYLESTNSQCNGALSWALVAPDGGNLGGTLVCRDLQREELQAAGIYTVRINGDKTAAGPYGFTVLAVPATVVAPVSAGTPVSGSLDSPGQWADYTFSGSAGSAVYLEHGAACTPGIGWEVHDPSGGVVAATVSCNDLARVELRTSGTYTLRFTGDHLTTGPYSFTLLTVPATVITPISIGQTISGAISAPGQYADYTFAGSPGDIVEPHALGVCVTGLSWQLLGPDGGLVDFAPACRDIDATTLKASGMYTIRLLGDRTSVGAYSFVLNKGG